jgi:hypothetical protein
MSPSRKKMKKLLASVAIILSISSANVASAQVNMPKADHAPLITGTATVPRSEELKSVGAITLKRTAIGCYDMQDTLNRKKAQRLADRADQILSDSLSSLDDFEQIKCQEFSPDEVHGAWNVIGQSLPELRSDKIAICVDSDGYIVGDHPTTRCFWIITDKTNVIWFAK